MNLKTLKVGEVYIVEAGHVTESDRFNKKYPKFLALCEAQDGLRDEGTQAVIAILEGIKKLEAMCAKIPDADFPDAKHPGSNESKPGYLYKLKYAHEAYSKALEAFAHNGAC